MPCDSVVVQSVELGMGRVNTILLMSALGALGWQPVILRDGVIRLEVAGSFITLNEDGKLSSRFASSDDLGVAASLIKREYAKQSVLAAAKKAGWAVKQQGQKLTLSRGRI